MVLLIIQHRLLVPPELDLLVVRLRMVPIQPQPQELLPPGFDRAEWVGCRLAELMPLDAASRQQLLEIDDALQRLEILAPLIEINS